MRNKSSALLKAFHQLLATHDPQEIEALLVRIRKLNAQLTYDQRMRCYDAALREAREQVVHDAAHQELDPATQAVLEELNGIVGKVSVLSQVSRDAAEALRDRLQEHLNLLSEEGDPQRVHRIIQETRREVEALPDEAIRTLGYYLLRGGLELRIVTAHMERIEVESETLSLFGSMFLASHPALALSVLRHDPNLGYSCPEPQELAEEDNLSQLKRGLEDYRETLHYATAQEAAKCATCLRRGIVCRLLTWLAGTDLIHDQEISDCTDALRQFAFGESRIKEKPFALPTYRVANVLYTTLCLGTEEDRETYRAAVGDQRGLLDACPELCKPLQDFTLFTLVLRLYQVVENTEVTFPPVLECLFRLYLALNLSDAALTDNAIYAWVTEVSK